MKNIALIAGTRPEVIKMLPVYLELRKRGHVTPRLVLTGQHRELAHDVLARFGVTPDLDMDVMQPGQTLVSLTGRLADGFAKYLKDSPPDAILVQGDTTSAMLGGLFGFYQNIPVGHVEAGLRTGNLFAPYPEEFNRRVITLAARWHFAPTSVGAANLARESVTRGVHITGNTVIDAALMMSAHETDAVKVLQQRFAFLNHAEKQTVLVTAHRRENFGNGIRTIANAIQTLSTEFPRLQFIIPAHPNPNVRPVFTQILQGNPRIHIIDPVGYDEVLFLMRRSILILTDSGGIQEEAPAFHVPVLVLRNETERPEGIEAGCSVLVGTDPATIESTFRRLMSNNTDYQAMAQVKNPYGDGQAAHRIADIILEAA